MNFKYTLRLLLTAMLISAGWLASLNRKATASSDTYSSPVPATISIQDFRTRLLNPAENKLKMAESIFSGLEKGKLIRGTETEDFVTHSDEYAKLMKQAFDEAISQAKLAADTQGARGNPTLVKEFESLAKTHERRTKSLAAQSDRIDRGIKDHVIKFDRPLLQRMSVSERTEYQNYLTTKGRVSIRKQHPDLFKAGPGGGGGMALLRTPATGKWSNSFIGTPNVSSETALHTETGFPATEHVEPAPILSLAAPCVGLCWAKQWSACAACVVAAGPAATNAYNTFVEEWNGSCSCKWYKPWCCAKKAYYLAKLVAKLA